MLKLSEDGLLPPGCHRCDIDDLYALFVQDDVHRQSLFREWNLYNKRLLDALALGPIRLTQWVDGSFVTNKPTPNDIDFVTFIPHDLYEPHEDSLVDFYSTISLHDSGLDAYICPVYPNEHPTYWLAQQYRTGWLKRFKKNKNTTGEKGFLELIL
jgi:hypothetical protein